MTYAATAGDIPSKDISAPRLLALQRMLIWLTAASSSIVFIEPSPYEIMTLSSAVFFCATGTRMRLALVPLLLLLILINVGYSIGAIPFYDKTEVASWIGTSWYMAITVMFFAMAMSEDTEARLDMLRRGLIVGAMIASISAIAGYLNLVPGGHDLLTLYGRGRGTFKDPNVLGAFLILPAVFALQSVVSDNLAKSLRNALAFGIMAFAVLIAFSRAAWGGLAITAAFMLILMMLTSRTSGQRARIAITSLAAVVLLELTLGACLLC